MSDLPPELRDRAARAAMSAHASWSKRFVYEGLDGPVSNRWNVVVDAVAEVLAEHLWSESRDRALRDETLATLLEANQGQDRIQRDLRARAERAEADLARARNLASEVLELMRLRLDGRPVSIGEAHTLIAWSRGVLASGPAGAAHTEEET